MPFTNNVEAVTLVADRLLVCIVLADNNPLTVNPVKLLIIVLKLVPLFLVIVRVLFEKVAPVENVSPVICVPLINKVPADIVVADTKLELIVFADNNPLTVRAEKLLISVLTVPPVLFVIVNKFVVKVTAVFVITGIPTKFVRPLAFPKYVPPEKVVAETDPALMVLADNNPLTVNPVKLLIRVEITTASFLVRDNKLFAKVAPVK